MLLFYVAYTILVGLWGMLEFRVSEIVLIYLCLVSFGYSYYFY